MNRITEAHIFVWRATPAIQCALRLFDSFNSETTKINYQFLITISSLKGNDRLHKNRVCHQNDWNRFSIVPGLQFHPSAVSFICPYDFSARGRGWGGWGGALACQFCTDA